MEVAKKRSYNCNLYWILLFGEDKMKRDNFDSNSKNTIRDGGSTALQTADTVNTVDTVDTVDTVTTVDTVDTVKTIYTVYTIGTAYTVYTIELLYTAETLACSIYIDK